MPSRDRTVALKIKQEIEVLTRLQSRALEFGSFIGMSTSERREYDNRRERINTLKQQLSNLENS